MEPDDSFRIAQPLLSEDPSMCEAVTSCRDPDPVAPCYESHECFHVAGHPGPHQAREHSLEWTDGTTWYREEDADVR